MRLTKQYYTPNATTITKQTTRTSGRRGEVVEIRGVEPLTFSMPLSVNNIEISTNYGSFRTLVALCIYFLYTKPR